MGSHRAEPRSRTSEEPSEVILRRTPAGGRRRETRLGRARRSKANLLPLPTLAGGAIVAAAVAGAVTIGQGAQAADHVNTAAFTGSDSIGFANGDYSRVAAYSRDSQRQSLQDAAGQSLQQQAEAANVNHTGALTALARQTESRAKQIALDIWRLPTINFVLTARFGQVSGLWSTVHTGLDFATATGTPIFAIANGTITQTGLAGPYGNLTVETLNDGTGTEIYYAHQSEIDVHVGQVVTGGQTIGKVGATGNTTGPHVHIEVRPGGGDPVDPYPQFIAHGVTP
ncbi:MAG TPA: M23 family metallopeptidase [Marmoricola sp.]|nr:M23 family metallopeptidase [Marmoricola sp.]